MPEIQLILKKVSFGGKKKRQKNSLTKSHLTVVFIMHFNVKF